MTEHLYQLFLQHPLICTDSRKVEKGSIFFALRGDNFNGNKYAVQAINTGAAYAVVDEKDVANGETILLVDDVLASLQQLAMHHRLQCKIPVLAITGSNGKTTTKELVSAVLAKKYSTLATEGNLNNHIGVPLTLLKLRSSHEIAVIEMGANHQGEIKMLCEIACPTHGVVTNVGKAHLEGFGGFEGVKKGKGELYDYLELNDGTAFVNAENPFLLEMSAKVKRNYFYGMGDSWYCSGKLLEAIPGVKMNWKCALRNAGGEIHAKLGGEYNFENILSSVCIGNFFGVEVNSISSAVEEYIPSNMRSQKIEKKSTLILLDAYNANPTSMLAALANFSKMEAENKVVILGDMMELGGESDFEHKALLEKISDYGFNEVVLVGAHFGKFKKEFQFHFHDTIETTASWLKEKNFKKTAFLIKGSRKMQLEKLTDFIGL